LLRAAQRVALSTWGPGLNTRALAPVGRPSSRASRAWEHSSRPRDKANLACSRMSQGPGPARSNSKTRGSGQGNRVRGMKGRSPLLPSEPFDHHGRVWVRGRTAVGRELGDLLKRLPPRRMTGRSCREFLYCYSVRSRWNPASAQALSRGSAPKASTGPRAPAGRTPSAAALPAAHASIGAVNE